MKHFIRNYTCIHFFLSYDFVEYTGKIDGKGKGKRLNGSRPGFTDTVRVQRPTLLSFRFYTDSSITRKGFKAQYNITFGK